MTSMDAGSSIPGPTHLNRDRILGVTARCFERYGYDGTTIRRIASMLGCAVGTIYRYFTDKRQLMYAVTQRTLESVVELNDSGESFDQSVRQYVQRAAAKPQMYRLMFWLACIGQNGQSPVPYGHATDKPIPTTMPTVVDKIVTGWSRRLGNRQLAIQCWSMLHGSLMLEQDNDSTVRDVLMLVNRPTSLAMPMRAAHQVATSTRNRTTPAPPVSNELALPPAVNDSPAANAEASAQTTSGTDQVNPITPPHVIAIHPPIDDVCLL